MHVEYINFAQVLKDTSEGHRESQKDVKEMFDLVSGGGKLDVQRFRDFCADFHIKDEDVDNMFSVR